MDVQPITKIKKYWMPIHYDTIWDKQNNESHLLLSFLFRILQSSRFIRKIYLSTNIFKLLLLDYYT